MSIGVITNAGRAYLARQMGDNADVNINRFLFANIPGLDINGDTNLDEAMPDVQFQVGEFNVTQNGYVSGDRVVYSVYLGPEVGDFTFNWVGLLADDDTLFAVRYIDPILKRASANGETGNAITRNFLINYPSIRELTNISIDASTWQLNFSEATEESFGLVRRASQNEVNQGENSTRYVSPATLANSIIDSLVSESTSRSLSANQGRVLSESVQGLVEALNQQVQNLNNALSQAIESHTHSADAISSGTLSRDRLPIGTASQRGSVYQPSGNYSLEASYWRCNETGYLICFGIGQCEPNSEVTVTLPVTYNSRILFFNGVSAVTQAQFSPIDLGRLQDVTFRNTDSAGISSGTIPFRWFTLGF